MRPSARPGRCRSCGQHILWARTPAGKWMPIVPDAQGRLCLDGNVVLSIPDGEDASERFTSHFSNCPEAKDWRKPKDG